MPPELDQALPVELDLLPQPDIYSYGFVMAAIFMNGTTPFQGLTADEVMKLKILKLKLQHGRQSLRNAAF
jgi:hypothetical protein